MRRHREANPVLCLSTPLTDCVRRHSGRWIKSRALPQHVPYGLRLASGAGEMLRLVLCLSTSLTDCVHNWRGHMAYRLALPQHVPYGLRRQICTKTSVFLGETCCELVDSFSGTQTLVPALAIFPNSSAAKATYVAINDSLGRTIDRFCGANYTSFLY